MENKYLHISSVLKQLDILDSNDDNIHLGEKYLSYGLLITGFALWIIFNILAIEFYQFTPYPLVVMNIILYCIIAVIASPNHYSEQQSSYSHIKNKHPEGALINMKQDYRNTKRPIPETDSETKENFPGYPKYPASQDIYAQFKEESEIDPENPSLLKDSAREMGTGTWNEKNFSEDEVGDDLDVPGSEIDNEQENNGMEDEENNYYSIGGDNHNDLEENKGE